MIIGILIDIFQIFWFVYFQPFIFKFMFITTDLATNEQAKWFNIS